MISINRFSQHFETFSHRFAKWIGSATGFAAAFLSLIVWLIIGEKYHYSNRWENTLSIYIGVITFLMIFFMQRAQNKDFSALQLKLNELIASSAHADNSLINAEELTEKEISAVHETHRQIVSE
jgi:low affinity Fe/Cu permease